MPTAKNSTLSSAKKHERVSFSKIPSAMEPPSLIEVQKESFERFMTKGLDEAFAEASPIENNAGTMEVSFGEHQFGDPTHTIAECQAKDISYQAPMLVEVRFVNKETGEIKEQLVFMGDFPLMTDRGTFIINGSERVVVSQLVRSPGVYFAEEMDNGVKIHRAQFIPARGAWLEFEVDKRGQLVVSIDRKRRQSATLLLRALGIANTDDEIIALLGDSDVVRSTIERDSAQTREDALIEIYRRQRPGGVQHPDGGRQHADGVHRQKQGQQDQQQPEPGHPGRGGHDHRRAHGVARGEHADQPPRRTQGDPQVRRNVRQNHHGHILTGPQDKAQGRQRQHRRGHHSLLSHSTVSFASVCVHSFCGGKGGPLSPRGRYDDVTGSPR